MIFLLGGNFLFTFPHSVGVNPASSSVRSGNIDSKRENDTLGIRFLDKDQTAYFDRVEKAFEYNMQRGWLNITPPPQLIIPSINHPMDHLI